MRWSVAALMALAGCGRSGFAVLSDADGADSSACTQFAVPAASELVDDFSDGVLAPNWTNGGTCMQEVGGELVASVPANAPAAAYCLAGSLARYHLTCSELSMHVAEATTQIPGVQMVVYVSGATQLMFFALDSGAFWFSRQDLTGRVDVPGGYDPVADAWWRLRERAGTIFFDTSPDGANWLVRGSQPVPFSLDDVGFSIGAGTYNPVANPGQGRFRCFNVPPPCQ